jgi:hypothetical protein
MMILEIVPCSAYTEFEVPAGYDAGHYQYKVFIKTVRKSDNATWYDLLSYTVKPYITNDTVEPTIVKIVSNGGLCKMQTHSSISGSWGSVNTTSGGLSKILSETYDYYFNADFYIQREDGTYLNGEPPTIQLISPNDTTYYNDFPNIQTLTTGYTSLDFVLSVDTPTEILPIRVLKLVENADCSSGTYVIMASDIPYEYGKQMHLTVSEATTHEILASKDFIVYYRKMASVEVMGITEGQSYTSQPNIIFKKRDYFKPVNLFFNGRVIYRSILPTEDKVYSAYQLEEVAGLNKIELKHDDGTVIKTYTYTINRTDGNVPINENPIDNTNPSGDYNPYVDVDPSASLISEAPNSDDYADDILGRVRYGFDTLFYWITFPFILLGQFIRELVTGLDEILINISSVTSFVSNLFSFLPSEVVKAFVSLILLTAVFFVIKIVRG